MTGLLSRNDGAKIKAAKSVSLEWLGAGTELCQFLRIFPLTFVSFIRNNYRQILQQWAIFTLFIVSNFAFLVVINEFVYLP